MHPHYFSRLLFGLVLILLGTAFMLDQLGIIPNLDFGELFKLYWPVILIFFGLKGLMFNKSLRYGWVGSIFWNFVIIMVGGYFLARNLGWIYIDIKQLWKFALPAFLILFGLSILFRSPQRRRHWSDGYNWSTGGDGNGEGDGSEHPYAERRRRAEERRAERHYWHDQRRERHRMRRGDWQTGSGQPDNGQGDLGQPGGPTYEQPNFGSFQKGGQHRTDRSGFVGDIFLGGDYWELKPTNVSHFIGDTTIDLTKAEISRGVTPIQISAFIGDVKIYVPNDADVAVSVTSSVFMGDQQVLNRYEGGMFKSMKEESPGYPSADKKIKINVSMFIGDIVVVQVG